MLKLHTFRAFLLASAVLVFSCGDDSGGKGDNFDPEGTYKANLVMEDGTVPVVLGLKPGGKATLKGLFGDQVTTSGKWEKIETKKGYEKDGVKASFESTKELRVVFMLKQAEGGLSLVDLYVRKTGKVATLQGTELKEKNTLFRRID